MIPYADHLLPETETPFNKALAAVSTRYEALDAPTRAFWDPWRCPKEHLKILAHAFSVDLWDDDWPETRKRSIIAHSIELHRLKGTLAGLKAYVRYTPGIILDVITPPQKVFSGPSLTKEEREAWLSSLPQIRVWRTHERASSKNKVFCGGKSCKMFVREGFFVKSSAKERRSLRLRYVVRGVEQEERVSEFGSYFRVHKKAISEFGAFCDSILPRQYYVPSTAKERLFTVQPAQVRPWRTPIRPTLRAVLSEPERVKVRANIKSGVFCCDFSNTEFFLPNTAWRRIYWRYPVYDGSPMPKGRPSIQFMRLDRYGWPPHVARLKISIPGKKIDWAAGHPEMIPKQFWVPSDASDRIDKTRRGIIASMRVSDKIELNYTGRKKLLSGFDILRAGIDEFII